MLERFPGYQRPKSQILHTHVHTQIYEDTQYVSMCAPIHNSVELRLMPLHYDRVLPG